MKRSVPKRRKDESLTDWLNRTMLRAVERGTWADALWLADIIKRIAQARGVDAPWMRNSRET